MAITRTEDAFGWTEKADTPEDARKLHEKHGKDIQKRGEEDFHRKYMQDLSVGFERVSDPHGNPTYVRSDRVAAALEQGYGKAPTGPNMVVPELPWQRDRRPGERWADYKRRVSGSKAED